MRFALIAYAHADQTLGQALAEDLRQRGIDVWLTNADDTTYERQGPLAQALTHCTAFLIVLSPAAEASSGLQTIIGLPHPRCEAVINVKASTIENNLDRWLDMQGEGINLMPVEFYDVLAKVRLIYRRRGGLLSTYAVLVQPWQHFVRIIAMFMVGVVFMCNLLLVTASGDDYNGTPKVGISCEQTSYPRVSMLDVTKTDKLLVDPNASLEFRGVASDRPVVRVYATQQNDEKELLARKQADFADIVFSLSDYEVYSPQFDDATVYVEVKCHGFCYYFILLKGGSSCE